MTPGIDEETDMGRVTVDLVVANHRDVVMADAGVIAPEKVRRLTIQGVVDTGATRLVLPESIAAQLGVPRTGETRVRYADQRRGTRPVVEDVEVEMLGRRGVFSALVEPDRTNALIGAIVMEDLDFLVDCGKQSIYPRDPEMVVSEVE